MKSAAGPLAIIAISSFFLLTSDSQAKDIRRAPSSVVQLALLAATDGVPNDLFGLSVAMSGNAIVVGAPFHPAINNQQGPGAAYVFVKPTSGWQNMTQVAELTASDGEPSDQFGYSVAIDNDTIVVGADVASVGGNSFQGAAYVFVERPGGWTTTTETAKLTASDGSSSDQFGFSVSISGSAISVGAIGYPRGDYQGAGYIFAEPAGGWTSMTQTAELIASDGRTNDEFGFSASLSGTTAVFGVRGLNPIPGAAYLFVEPESGWTDTTQTAKLTASDGTAKDGFGYAVSISGNTAVVGSPYKTGSYHDQGAGYVFVEPVEGWADMNQPAELTPLLPVSAMLGFSVYTTGNIVLIGAPGNGHDLVLAFLKPATGWTNTSKFAVKVTDSDPGSNFGVSVSMSGFVGVVGAPDENNQQGIAYVFGEQ